MKVAKFEQLNHQYQLALRSPSDAAVMLRKNTQDLSAKQSKALRAVATAASARSEERRAERAVSAPVARKSKAQIDWNHVRLSPSYAHLWRQLGCHRSLPIPYPPFSGPSGRFRYATMECFTTQNTIYLTTGQNRVIFCNPFYQARPVIIDSTTYYANTFTWGKDHAMLDFWTGAFVPDNTCEWQRYAPCTVFGDSNAIKSGGYMKLPSANTATPQVMCVLGGELSVSVAVPWDGLAEVRTLSAGDQRTIVGAMCPSVSFDSEAVGSSCGLHAAFRGSTQLVNHQAVATIPAVVAAYAKPHIQMGGSNEAVMHYRIPFGHADWRFAGTLDATDAASAGYVSSQNNLSGRDNPIDSAQFGFAVVNNVGSSNIAVSVSMRAIVGVLVNTDDATTSIGQLASAVAFSCERLQRTENVASSPQPTSVATSSEGIRQAVHEKIRALVGPNVARHVSSNMALEPAAHNVMVGAAGALGGAAGAVTMTGAGTVGGIALGAEGASAAGTATGASLMSAIEGAVSTAIEAMPLLL